MEKGKIAVLVDAKEIRIRQYPVPDVRENDMLLEIVATGVCGTDYHIWRNPNRIESLGGAKLPVVLGHEITAKISEIGKNAVDGMYSFDIHGNKIVLEEGDRVVVYATGRCGECWGELTFGTLLAMCENPIVYGLCSVDDWPHFSAGFGDYLYIFPKTWLWKIPDEMSSEVAAMTDTFSVGVRAVEKAMSLPGWLSGSNVTYGGNVVVQGSGAIGILTAAAARIAGVAKIIMTGAPQWRLDLAEQIGVVDQTINIEEVSVEKRVEEIKKLTPNRAGADVVIDCTGVPSAVSEGLDMVREYGSFVEVGNFANVEEYAQIYPARQIVLKNVTIYGVGAMPPQYFTKTLKALSNNGNEIPFEKIVTHKISVEKTQEAFNLMDKMEGLKILITGSGYNS